MRTLIVLTLALSASCGGRHTGPMPPVGTPLSATLDGRTYAAPGIVGQSEMDGVIVYVFDRPAPCGPDAEARVGEQYFQIYLPGFHRTPNGTHVDLWESSTAVNTVQRSANGGSATAMNGAIDVLSVSPTGGTIVVDASNGKGSLRGQIAFPICPRQ